jgi:hypothetical protein
MQVESKMATGSQHGMHVRWQLSQETGQMGVHHRPQLFEFKVTKSRQKVICCG